MPTYSFFCPECQVGYDAVVRVADRDVQACVCGTTLARRLAAPLFKFQGVVTPGGGADRFTADMMGIPLKELPSGLRTGK
jgi:putative FmdB family regulatory protein